MTSLSRRSFLSGLGALIAAPAVIRTPGLLMPVRALEPAYTHLTYATGYVVEIIDTGPGPLVVELLKLHERARREIEEMTGIPRELAESLTHNRYISSVMAIAR